MRRYLLILILFAIYSELYGQTQYENLSGQVSFISTQNIYVKFKSTEGISAGDTLFVSAGGSLSPSMVVLNLSSTSCVCSQLSKASVPLGTPVIARIVRTGNLISEAPDKPAITEVIKVNDTSDSVQIQKEKNSHKQNIRGSISLNSYTDISNTDARNSQRYRYTFSLDARNIANSKLSVETYVSFKHKAGEWADVKSSIFNALKIYNLSFKYDINKTTKMVIGRQINYNISSIGAVDGLQIEKTINRFSFGALAGTRPDYIDYGFNIKLLQYGAYIAYKTKTEHNYSETSLAFMQQMNNSKTDRRFLYFQHSNTFIKNLSFFSTFEMDLYELKVDSLNNEMAKNTFNPTGLYLSLNYRPLKSLSISGSYDARKNIMYYETFKTFTDRVLENELRQGFRVQASYRITNDLIFGIQGGYRFLKSDPHPSRNIYSYVTYSEIPGVRIAATISGTYMESSYLNGMIYGINLSREFFKRKLYWGMRYQYVDTKLPDNKLDVIQHIGEVSLSWQIYNALSFSMNYEGTFENNYRYDRVYLQLRMRF